LDWDNQYRIDTGAAYFTRHGAWLEWPMEDLVTPLAGPPVSFAELRTRFQDGCEAAEALQGLTARRRTRAGQWKMRHQLPMALRSAAIAATIAARLASVSLRP